MMGFADEKDLLLVTIIAGIFILTTLSPAIGGIYAAMAMATAIALNQGKGRILEFTRGKGIGSSGVFLGFLLIGAFLSIAALVLGSQELVTKAVTFFASSFLQNFTIDNPAIRFLVFGFVIPVVETLFFYNFIFKFILSKAHAKFRLDDMPTLVSIALVAGIATAFHFYVRLLNDQALLTDLIFFSASGVIVVLQRETSGAAVGHIGNNSYFMAKILGWVR